MNKYYTFYLRRSNVRQNSIRFELDKPANDNVIPYFFLSFIRSFLSSSSFTFSSFLVSFLSNRFVSEYISLFDNSCSQVRITYNIRNQVMRILWTKTGQKPKHFQNLVVVDVLSWFFRRKQKKKKEKLLIGFVYVICRCRCWCVSLSLSLSLTLSLCACVLLRIVRKI